MKLFKHNNAPRPNNSKIRPFDYSIIFRPSHRGSALLIVLGMLSFMVVSAVGFSVYMRQSRLPSSYLRRNVSSRYLVKAALANAIEELDCGFMSNYEIGIDEKATNPNNGRFFGIYDDPYPGCGSDSNRSNMQSGSRKVNGRSLLSYCENGDLWVKRVFCPFGLLPFPSDETSAVKEPPMTVPTLTLEALAYLPPAIIDDVRKVSRMTRTAMWRSLPYEAGRYAYTAVNVSDLFDINRLRANEPRDSGLNRVTMSTLTSKDPQVPSQVDPDRAKEIDEILDPDANGRLRFSDGVLPFLSLADFELSAQLMGGSKYAPLLLYVGGSDSAILKDEPEMANAMFITDTWFPPSNTNATEKTYDLAISAGQPNSGQPFTSFNAMCFLGVWEQLSAECGDVYNKNLGPGIVCLYDYLDGDSIPISFIFPTTEAVPMVVGIDAPVNGSLRPVVDKVENPCPPVVVEQDGEKYTVQRTITTYRLSQIGSPMVNVSVAYPFKRMQKTKRQQTFKIRCLMKIFLSPTDDSSRFSCRPAGANLGFRPTDEATFTSHGISCSDGIVSVMSDSQSISSFIDNSLMSANGWIQNVRFQFNEPIPGGQEIPICQKVEEKWEGIRKDEDSPLPPAVEKTPRLTLDGIGDRPLIRRDGDAKRIDNGSVLTRPEIDNPLKVPIESLTEMEHLDKDYRLYLAFWVQVLDNKDNVVDMVPACAEDDFLWCKPNLGVYRSEKPYGPIEGKGVIEQFAGEPLLYFPSDLKDLQFKDSEALSAKLSAPVTFNDSWKTLLAVDPRFNHAPENWFCTTRSESDPTRAWTEMIALNQTTVMGQNGRDRDVFMFVSDQEYLQSVGELQFLPRLVEMQNDSSFGESTYAIAANHRGEPFGNRMVNNPEELTLPGTFMDGAYFWRTYSAYPHELDDPEAELKTEDFIEGNPFKLPIKSDVGGFKVNPFSDDIRMLSAVVANTPFDYYASSTNSNQRQLGSAKNQVIDAIDLKEALQNYTFGENNDIAKLQTDDLNSIIDTIMDHFADMAENGESDWVKVWNCLGWQFPGASESGDENKKFIVDHALETALHCVDRKFLYSFWRECFDNRQQLFLIFVNAEPASVGGGAAGGVSSSQQGGKAVALVWRDPAKPTAGGVRQPRPGGSIDRDQFRQDYKRDRPPHRTRVLFYHQFD